MPDVLPRGAVSALAVCLKRYGSPCSLNASYGPFPDADPAWHGHDGHDEGGYHDMQDEGGEGGYNEDEGGAEGGYSEDEGGVGGYSEDEGDEGGKDGPYDEGEGGAYDEGSYDDNGDGDEEWRSDDGYDDEAADGGHGADDAFRDKASGAGYSGRDDLSAPAADWDVTFHDKALSRTLVKLLQKLLPTDDSHITLSKLGSKIPPVARPYVKVSEMRYLVPLIDSRTHPTPFLGNIFESGCWQPEGFPQPELLVACTARHGSQGP